jgi:ferredoxin--NADP+ reductase
MKLLVSHLDTPKNSSDLTELITHEKVVSQHHWEQINAAEIAAGEPLGKPRRKAISREDLLNLGGLS